MSNADLPLPEDFSSLSPFVAKWGANSTAGRKDARLSSTEAERTAFYNSGIDVYQSALAYLDQKPFSEYDAKDNNLMNTLLSFAHVSLAVEIQKGDEEKHARLRKHMKITQASADR